MLVAVRPWVRVDGTLNRWDGSLFPYDCYQLLKLQSVIQATYCRRVLDRLLGAALGLVMQGPGQTVQAVLDRLCPALQPAHSR